MAEKIKITFLGTSSQIPTARRNHSAFLLQYKGENLLIDCGEGTQRQFRKAKLNPVKITGILISHWHGDHVLGLPGLLETLAHSGRKKDLYVHGPKGIKVFLKKLLELFTFKREYKIIVKETSRKVYETKDFYIDSKPMKHARACNAYNFVIKGQIRINKFKLKKSKLPHGPILSKLKQGKDIKYQNKVYKAKDLTFIEGGKKVSFVMDTLNNKAIIPFVQNSDILIIETSYMDELQQTAREHSHMTSKQVANIAKKANVKKLYLTHLSSRYDKDPKVILNEAKKIFKNSFLSEDLDTIQV